MSRTSRVISVDGDAIGLLKIICPLLCSYNFGMVCVSAPIKPLLILDAGHQDYILLHCGAPPTTT